MSRVRLPAAAAVLALLTCLPGCSSAPTSVEACMGKQAVGATPGQLAGTYRGEGDAKGVTLTLKASQGKPGSGTVTVHDWPTGDWYRSELGETFDGSGTWSVVQGGTSATEFARLTLDLTTPKRFLEGDTLDSLAIAEGDGRTYLYTDDDPDVCPAFRLRLQGA
ncbi:hypothetical protein [Streptomyces sp. SID5910]|uniref:hypothetical protein n=1 Tax=Streptomyces sp. SID5910 TaxID=2690312 RepID=UPI00136BBFCD|nr:hypothetical protein [Streptomyces sp. SID5910]MYR44326.1 hypothetical protein [Streptomyces sp. SID5910]